MRREQIAESSKKTRDYSSNPADLSTTCAYNAVYVFYHIVLDVGVSPLSNFFTFLLDDGPENPIVNGP
jgi:hypothetical protein